MYVIGAIALVRETTATKVTTARYTVVHDIVWEQHSIIKREHAEKKEQHVPSVISLYFPRQFSH